MDKQTNTIKELYNIDILKNRVLDNIRDYMSKPENETGEKITEMQQTQFDYMLKNAGRATFGGMDTSNDILFLCLLCIVYIDINAKYNKIVSFEGFAMFSGVPCDYIKTWINDVKTMQGKQIYIDNIINGLYQLYSNYDFNVNYIINNNLIFNICGFDSFGDIITACRACIYSRLQGFRENEIKNGFLSSKQQLGAVALVNREFAWNADNVAQIERARALTLADLPKMSNYVNRQNRLETSEP